MNARQSMTATRMLVAAACLVIAAQQAGADHAEHTDHAAMDHAQHDAARDELGRSLHDMKHQMDPALMQELRERVPLYHKYSDAEIALSMDMMGPEYAWYISPPQLRGKQGVLILLHGFRDQGDKVFRDRMQPIGNIFPTSLGIGMAMMMSSHIQIALDDLKAAGAQQVAVVPVVSSASNELYQQWLYIFGHKPQPRFATVPKIRTDLEVILLQPPGDNPLVAEILLDHALEQSTDPKREAVIIAGHGPTEPGFNEQELAALAGLARIVQEDGGFASVRGITLQDDAPAEIRAANVQKLRSMVEEETRAGRRVIVVTNLIGARTIQAKLREDLKGLEFSFNNKGIVQHDNFMKWMSESVRKAFEDNARPEATAAR
ncbi:MAG: hypothetical protein IT486_06890 [Gammaproteobacteria bacterium]|nr:hypothetical protein [Gammaproteobacteria bacterium]